MEYIGTLQILDEDGINAILDENGSAILDEGAPEPISMNNYLFVNAGGSGSEKIR